MHLQLVAIRVNELQSLFYIINADTGAIRPVTYKFVLAVNNFAS